jgi:hypothetical protein
MSDSISRPAVGDYVIPAPDEDDLREFPHWDRMWPPCRVKNVYKNGGLRARSDSGDCEWRGPVSGFKVVPVPRGVA